MITRSGLRSSFQHLILFALVTQIHGGPEGSRSSTIWGSQRATSEHSSAVAADKRLEEVDPVADWWQADDQDRLNESFGCGRMP